MDMIGSKMSGKKISVRVFVLKKIAQIKKWNANQQAGTELDFMKTNLDQYKMLLKQDKNRNEDALKTAIKVVQLLELYMS